MTTKAELIKRVRLGCSECMGGARANEGIWPIKNPSDVDGCTSPDCVWFDFRMGKDPAPNAGRVKRGVANSHLLRSGAKQKVQISIKKGCR
jgi:hypothetical protein